MMLSLLVKFLPADKRALLDLALRMVANLDTAQERRAVADYGIKMIAGGVTVSEWATFGKKLGVFKLEEKK
jgi:hypothetical protein